MMRNQMQRYIGQIRRMSLPMSFAVCLLLVISVMFIYSACFISEGQEVQSFYKKQIVWGFVGIASYLFFAIFDYRKFRRVSSWIYGVGLVLLVLVLLIGTSRYGAKRWIAIAGVNVQPSELMKVAVIISLGSMFSNPSTNMNTLKTFFLGGFLAAVPFFMILAQPDMGTGMVLVPVTFAMMFVGGVPLKYLGTVVGLMLTFVMMIVMLLVLPAKLGAGEEIQEKFARFTGLKDHQRKRVMVYLGMDKDPLGSGWNKKQSQIAVGSGGAWGKGFCEGKQNILGFLPRSVAPTDFIYSVIAEEKGFFGSAVVLVLYGMVFVSGLRGAIIARDRLGRLLCVGVVTMLFSHVFVNIAMTVGLVPITGLPLPLLSYGGTFMVVVMSALGIVQSVFIRSRRADTFSQGSASPLGYSG